MYLTLDYTKKYSESCSDSDSDSDGVRDSVGGPVVVVRHRHFNRHLNVPWEKTGLIHLQSVHEVFDKLLTESVSPV
jgi:hypothetical protein